MLDKWRTKRLVFTEILPYSGLYSRVPIYQTAYSLLNEKHSDIAEWTAY
jgi:hypothetical protein